MNNWYPSEDMEEFNREINKRFLTPQIFVSIDSRQIKRYLEEAMEAIENEEFGQAIEQLQQAFRLL